jgi:hypothetical protein
MKKAGLLLSLVLASLLIFSTGVFAQYVEIGFSGPYTLEDLDGWGIDPASVPSVWICDWNGINETWEGDPPGMPAPEIPGRPYHYLWHADEDLPDFEFESEYYLVPGHMDPYYTKVIDDGNYLHFSGGDGIPFCTYFDVYVKPLDFPVNELDPSNFGMHATPIPGAVWLLGSGFIGLAAVRRRYTKS